MKFNPISQEEADRQSDPTTPWPPGDYDFEIRDASEQTSAAGNEMIKLEAWIYDGTGSRRLVFDYLVASEKSAWKIRHFAEACGMSRQYETGTLMVAEIVSRTGRCTVGVQPARDSFPARNFVRDYVTAKTPAAPRPASKKPVDDLDDEIPF